MNFHGAFFEMFLVSGFIHSIEDGLDELIYFDGNANSIFAQVVVEERQTNEAGLALFLPNLFSVAVARKHAIESKKLIIEEFRCLQNWEV